jgi:uncharacterized repeat protein (TIGR01451 family)
VSQPDLLRRTSRGKWGCTAVALLLAVGFLAGSARAQPGMPVPQVIASSSQQPRPETPAVLPAPSVTPGLLPVALPSGPGGAPPNDGWGIPGRNRPANQADRTTSSSLQTVAFIPALPSVGKPGTQSNTRSVQELAIASPVSPGASLALTVSGPSSLEPGQLLPFEIVVHNNGAAALTGVRVEQALPDGVQVLKTEPLAEATSGRLVWNLGTLEMAGERRLHVELQPGNLSAINLAPTATFSPVVGLQTRISQPSFAIVQLGPDVVQAGDTVQLTVQVANHGPTPLHHVRVRDRLPDGLRHNMGDLIEADLGTLQPGEIRTLPLEALAVRTGQLVNAVEARTQEGQVSSSRRNISIKDTGLFLKVSGQKQAAAGALVDLKLAIHNVGPQAAANIQLQVVYPEGLEIVGSTIESRIDPDARVVFWTLPRLAGGQTHEIILQVRGRSRGDWSWEASVAADGLAATRSVHALHVND